MIHWMCTVCTITLLLPGTFQERLALAAPTAETPLVVNTEKKEVQVFGWIYPVRFNSAQGEEAHYHFMVWQKGTSPHALIETPADDLDFHAALITLGAVPGDNLTMSSWTERNNLQSDAPRKKVTGSEVLIDIAWNGKSTSLPIARVFNQIPTPSSQSLETWRFGGNKDRLFNHIPFAQRPGCLVCLYSCPSGKVSNAALSIHDYGRVPTRYVANTAVLPPDGTPVTVIFSLRVNRKLSD